MKEKFFSKKNKTLILWYGGLMLIVLVPYLLLRLLDLLEVVIGVKNVLYLSEKIIMPIYVKYIIPVAVVGMVLSFTYRLVGGVVSKRFERQRRKEFFTEKKDGSPTWVLPGEKPNTTKPSAHKHALKHAPDDDNWSDE